MSILQFVILCLATARLVYMIQVEDLPFDLMAHFRDKIGVRYDERSNPYGTNLFAKMVVCPWCLSIWIAIATYFGPLVVSTILAISMGGILTLKLGIGYASRH